MGGIPAYLNGDGHLPDVLIGLDTNGGEYLSRKNNGHRDWDSQTDAIWNRKETFFKATAYETRQKKTGAQERNSSE